MPFDTSIRDLPAGYNGHNAEDVWKLLQRRSTRLVKSEYETKAVFEKRRETLLDEPLTGNLRVSSTYAFVVDTYSTYDAESQVLNVALPGANSRSLTNYTSTSTLCEPQKLESPKHWLDMDLTPHTVINHGWSVHTVHRDWYDGMNAFGVAKRVRRDHSIRQNIVADVPQWLNDSSLRQPGSQSEAHISIPMSSSDARQHKADLRAIFVGSLECPFVTSSIEYSKRPTIDTPIDILVQGNNIHLKLKELWYFDHRTGKVFARLGEPRHESLWPLHVLVTGSCDEPVSVFADGLKKGEEYIDNKGIHVVSTSH